MAKERDRILGFDLARVVAIFVVIGIYHNFGYAGLRYYYDAGTKSLSYTALGVFTFLSAFLLSSKYTFSTSKEIITFLKKRVVRIWPLFAISSFILVLIHFNELLATLKGLVGLSPFWAPAPTTMWYVAMLISLYMLTPFVLCGKGVLRQCTRVVLVMTLLGLIQIVFKSVVPKTHNYYTVFFAGLLLGHNYYEPTMRFLSAKKTFIVSVIWGILYVIVWITGNNYLKTFTGILGIVAILNLCLIVSYFFVKVKEINSIISTLAYSSFCAYLFHREIIWLLLRVKSLGSGWSLFFEVLLVGVPLTFIIAYVLQHFYDMIVIRINNLK